MSKSRTAICAKRYHLLQTSLQKRFSQGYMPMGSYPYSKFMQAVAYLNATDQMPLETISDFDTPHRISMSGVWELPFGKNKAYRSGLNAVASRLVSGWQV